MTLVMQLALWFLLTGVFHFTALVLDGNVEFPQLMLRVGYGYLPEVVANGLSLTVSALAE